MPSPDPRELQDLLGGPQGFATYWLGGWLDGENAGIADQKADSRALRPNARTGQDERLTFEQLGWQPILTAMVLEHLVRIRARQSADSSREPARLLASALAFLARDFESLLLTGRADTCSLEHLRLYVRAVKEAETLLQVDFWNGGMHPRDSVAGWEKCAPVARALATSVVRATDAPELPAVPSEATTFAGVDTYIGDLLRIVRRDGPVGELTSGLLPTGPTQPGSDARATQLPPEKVRVELDLLAEEVRIDGKSLRRERIPTVVWNMFRDKIAPAVGEWMSRDEVSERRFSDAGCVRIVAAGRNATELKRWWGAEGGPGDPLTPAGKKAHYYVAFKFRLAPGSNG
jgi:hypothetical protein